MDGFLYTFSSPYRDKARLFFANGDSVAIDLHLYQINHRACPLILPTVLQNNAEILQGLLTGGDTGQFISASALEVVELPIKGHNVGITRHHACGIVHSIATSNALNHLTLLTRWAASLLHGQLPFGRACEPLIASIPTPEGGTDRHIPAFVQAATLGLGHTFAATEHKPIIASTCLHTAGFAVGGSSEVSTDCRTAGATALIVAVLLALGWC